MKLYPLDGAKLADKASAHAYLKTALALPEHYGNNLDALHDCLSELQGCLWIMDAAHLPAVLARVLEDSARENPALIVHFSR